MRLARGSWHFRCASTGSTSAARRITTRPSCIVNNHAATVNGNGEGLTMRADYDAKIAAHYDQVAADCGLSPHSTMADEIIREKETAVIVDFVDHALRECPAQAVAADRPARPGAVTVLDVGCGNGYTLKTLANVLPAGSYLGIEQNSKLRELAQQQVAEQGNGRVLPGALG